MLEHFCHLRRIRPFGFGLALILALSWGIQPAQAQQFRGSISGTVTDQTSGVIVGVEVKLTNQGTNISHPIITTNGAGVYRLSGLEIGMYTIEFTKSGFQAKIVKDIEVKTSSETTLNPGLDVNGAPTTTEVTDIPGATLSKADAGIQMTLPGRLMDMTPLSTSSLVPGGARNDARYALLAPGVVRVLGQNEFSVNGHRGRENNFKMDGTDNNDNTITLPALFTPPEAIAEFQVKVATFSAEDGRNMGAQVNAITKSGTNVFHGETWEFYRGSALEPLSLQNRKAGLTSTPRLVDNQFGVDVGGPIIKNKTFFFALIQGNRQRQAPTAAGSVTIPTAAGLAELSSVPLRAAATDGSFPAQSVASRQAMLNALSFLPGVFPQHYDKTSTVSVNSTLIDVGTFNPLVPQNQNLWYGVIQLDHQLTPNDRLAYRVHIDDRDQPLSVDNLAFAQLWGGDSKYAAQNHSLSYTKTIGSSFVNEARLAYTRLDPSFVERDPVDPTVTLNGLFTIGGFSNNFPQQRLEQTYELQNVSTYIVNRHSLKFGVDLDRTHAFINNAFNSKGTWTFANLQDFMNNQATSLTQLVSQAARFSFSQLKQAYFFQDDIKVTRTFTANLGMRYETSSVPLGFFGATDPAVLAADVPGPVKRDTNNWGPRIGFAYSPTVSNGILGKMLGDGKSAIRGGFGIGYDVLFYNLLGSPAANYPRTNTQTTPAATLIDTFPTLAPKSNVITFSPTLNFANLPSDAQNPTTNYWSLSVQRQLGKNYMLEVGYIGNRSYHLVRQGQANPGILPQAKADAVIAGCTSSNLSSCQDPNQAVFPASPARLDPTLGSRTLLATDGESSYNAGYFQLEKKSSFGLQLGANYTWSANLSDSDELFPDITTGSNGGIGSSSPPVPQNYLDRHNEWARSAFDRPQRMTFHETYAIPFFAGAAKILQSVFSGWQLTGFTEIQSGAPFTITVGVDTLGAGTSSVPGRPNFNPGGILIMDPTTGNLRTFTIPLDGTGIVTAPHVTDPSNGKVTFLRNSMPIGGTLGRNTFRGPGYSNTNLSLMKNFKISGEKTLEIRGDFLNAFNHDNFANPDANMSHTTFGQQVFAPLTDARQVVVGAKFRF